MTQIATILSKLILKNRMIAQTYLNLSNNKNCKFGGLEEDRRMIASKRRESSGEKLSRNQAIWRIYLYNQQR